MSGDGETNVARVMLKCAKKQMKQINGKICKRQTLKEEENEHKNGTVTDESDEIESAIEQINKYCYSNHNNNINTTISIYIYNTYCSSIDRFR